MPYQQVSTFFLNEASVTLSPLRVSGGAFSQPVSNETHDETVTCPVAPPEPGAGGGDSGSDNLTKDANFNSRARTQYFRSSARNKLRRAGQAADTIDPNPSAWMFLTGTLPSVEMAAFRAIARQSGAIVNRLNTWLRAKLSRHDLFFYCWERQKRGALHLHYCCRVDDKDEAKAIISGFKTHWINTLKLVGKSETCAMFVGSRGVNHLDTPSNIQAEAQVVVKSVARYLSKYVSKDSEQKERRWSEGLDAPARWWGCSQRLKREVEKLTTKTRKVFAAYLPARNSTLILIDKLRHYAENEGRLFQLQSCCGFHFTIFGENKWRNHMEHSGLKKGSLAQEKEFLKMETGQPFHSDMLELFAHQKRVEQRLKAALLHCSVSPSVALPQWSNYSQAEELEPLNWNMLCEKAYLIQRGLYFLCSALGSKSSCPLRWTNARSRLHSSLKSLMRELGGQFADTSMNPTECEPLIKIYSEVITALVFCTKL